MKKKKNAFTLIELLAVIVILAVILVISIPRILDVIETSKKDSFKSTAQLIADSAEKKYVTNKLNNIDEEITCDKVAKISSKDYEYCFVKIDEEGKATVTIEGKGKFKDLAICNGTKENAELKEGDSCATDAKYFAYEEVEGGISITGYNVGTSVTVKDINKCETYLVSKFSEEITEEIATTLCSGNSLDGVTLQRIVSAELIPSTDYEVAGIEITETGGTDVIIPEKIDGKTVVGISKYAFTTRGVTPTGISTNKIEYNIQPLYNKKDNYEVVPLGTASDGLGITSVIIPNTVKIIGKDAFWGNKLTSVTIPNSVTSIGDSAFGNNQLTNIIIPNSVTSIGDSAFSENQLTSVTIPNSVTSIGDWAFGNNQLTSVTIPSSVTSIGNSAFYKSISSNSNLTKIINKTDKVFDWGTIVNSSSGYNFVTGTVVNSNGNVEVVNN